jgi:hypothetical protein
MFCKKGTYIILHALTMSTSVTKIDGFNYQIFIEHTIHTTWAFQVAHNQCQHRR